MSSHYDQILTNIANNLYPVQKMITGAAYIMGAMFALKALYSLKVYGEARTMMSSSTSIKEPVVYLFVAAVFIYFPTALKVFLMSTFGTDTLRSENVETPWGTFSTGLVVIIQTIGLITFIRGWVLIARSASQGQPPGGTGKGLMHVFGGLLAINIVGTLKIINNTIYGS